VRKNSIINNLDWITISIYLLLVVVGVMFIFSTSHSPQGNSIFDLNTSSGKQIMWFGLSVIVAGAILILDVKFYSSFAYIIYGLVIAMLVSVLIFGVTINGSKSWFAFGPVRFQPAELAKFATSLALAKFMTNLNVNLERLPSKLWTTFIIGLPTLFILLQGDVGSALVFAGFVFVLHREGLESGFLLIGFGLIIFSLLSLIYNPFDLFPIYTAILILFVYFNKKHKYPALVSLAWIIGLTLFSILYFNLASDYVAKFEIDTALPLSIVFLLILIVGAIIKFKKKNWIVPVMAVFMMVIVYTFSVNFLFNNALKQHHRDRIDLILGKIEDRSGVGYNLFQSKIAIGSGGLTGKGYLQGTQTMLNFVPEQSTDFIFTSIAEELGFLGSVLIIGLFVALLLRIIAISERQRSRFARVYGYSVASILFAHFSVNISMTIGLAPVIGIPLPFVSYGGSSLLAFSILLFVLLKLDTERLNVFR
jgi:rod shape determining protein RodA